MVGGLSASIILFIMRKTMVHDKLVIKKKPVRILRMNFNKPVPTWERVYPRGK